MSNVPEGHRPKSAMRCVVLEAIDPAWIDREGYVSNLPFPYLTMLGDPSVREAQGVVTTQALESAKHGKPVGVVSNQLYKVRILEDKIIQELDNGRRAEITPGELRLFESMTTHMPQRVYYRYARKGVACWGMVKEYRQVRHEPAATDVPMSIAILVKTVDHWIWKRWRALDQWDWERWMAGESSTQATRPTPPELQPLPSLLFAGARSMDALFWVSKPGRLSEDRHWFGDAIPTDEEQALYTQARAVILEADVPHQPVERPDLFLEFSRQGLVHFQKRLLSVLTERRAAAFETYWPKGISE